MEKISEGFLTEEDFKGLEIPTKEELAEINGHEDGFSIKKNNGRSSFDDGDQPIGITPTGLPRYRSDNPGEMYKVIDIKNISRVSGNELDRDCLAYIKVESLNLIRDRFHINTENTELVKRLVVFKGGTSVSRDDFYPVSLGGDNIIAIKNINIDESELPYKTESYTYLANLTNDMRGLKRKHTTIYDDRLEHQINLPIGRDFLVDSRKAIETKISIIDRNGISQRKR